MATQPIVKIQNLNHFYGVGELRQQVLFEINLSIASQEFIIITGPSGSGKSTLLGLMGCLRSVQNGSLKILGQELRGATPKQLVQMRRNFGYITQASNLLDFLTAQQNVQMSLELIPELSGRQRCHQAQKMLAAVGLSDRRHYYPHNLSGGERQRVAIACALVSQPQLVLADEPTAALDKVSGRNAIALMHRLAKEQGSAVVMVTHDNRILDLADRIVKVEDGRLELALNQELLMALPGLDEALLSQNAPPVQVANYNPNDIIIQQGDPATQFFVLLSGEAEVYKEYPHQPPKLINRLHRGQYFGEIGLLEGGIRTATVRVSPEAPVQVMTIAREDFHLLMQGSDVMNRDIIQRLYKRVFKRYLTAILPTLDLETLENASVLIKMVRYGPNSNIIQPGDILKQFYMLARGQVEIFSPDRPEQYLKRLLPGEAFGIKELTLGEPYPYIARVTPTAEAELLVLEKAAFSQLISSAYQQPTPSVDPDVDRIAARLQQRLLKNLAKHLQQSQP
ncbi:MAG: cyclic nucleotide-binding domain-containing protein [Jaaginema sp. PMC 1079.18]|nr:cyclic nucleotide-binding domain-containing protein [Jaaginema sp. PMC 1080.18]MEC4851866.1 cyclic nucleotide-binding domain-containing protein [Jaaginema sp. PMC 1079.18]MEC4866430.1 cyclic nucleotide-binding domain-containing protein [Jaaginema sp. PMC 1078.18]